MIAVEKLEFTPDFRRISDRVVRGETVLIPQPTSKNLIVLTEDEYKEMDAICKKDNALKRFDQTIKSMQKKAVLNGTAGMSDDEINSIIKEARAEIRAEREKEAMG